MLPTIPQAAVDAFSQGRRQTERNAKRFAKEQEVDWDELTAERKFGLMSAAATVECLTKNDTRTDQEVWRDQAAAMGWHHKTVMEGVAAPALANAERFERAYACAAKHLATEFHTTAVLTQDKVRTIAARSLIGVGTFAAGADGSFAAMLSTVVGDGCKAGELGDGLAGQGSNFGHFGHQSCNGAVSTVWVV
jgi:hypothetical protein